MADPPLLDALTILRFLARHETDFIVIGALGATFHGSPLRTGDVDICPSPKRQNLQRLARALTDLNAAEWDPHKGEAVSREWNAEMLEVDTVWILHTDYGALDLAFEPGGTGGYGDLIRDAVTVELEDFRVRVASLADIIRSKEAVGRPKDEFQLPTLRRLLDQLEEQ